MDVVAPTGLLTGPRSRELAVGCAAAAQVLATVFPPRPEDDDGTLALTSVEVLANHTMAAAVTARTDTEQRRWWLEGFAVGFAVCTVQVLTEAAEHAEYSVRRRLEDMAAHVMPRLDVAQEAGARLAFDLAHAVNNHDDVSLAWLLETLWQPADPVVGDVSRSPAAMAERYKRTLVGAVNTACAAWRLLLLLRETPDLP